ncbi:MAG: hypothetical protein A3G80_12830 [Betaproteobacteria bacterium RIFCSPLOWO2_12_FULL_62_13b]|nr:MAG: hypothetical protein A3G80_12830 [Betaproteobacteria bacterium RIFCSPLOWO2_12_FULL_62_13b]
MTEAEAVALAIAFGAGLGTSINRQMALQRLASGRPHAAGFFTRFTHGVLSWTLLIGAAITAEGTKAFSFEGFMTVMLAVTFALVWTQRSSRKRLLRP